MIEVVLNYHELYDACYVGVTRMMYDLKKGLKDKHGADSNKNGWQLSIIGAIGEFAWAKNLGVPWDGAIGDFKAGDVANWYEIRSTQYTGRNPTLVGHKGDKPDRPYIVAQVILHQDNRYHVMFKGWAWGKELIQQKNWKDWFGLNRPCFGIKADDARSMKLIVGPDKQLVYGKAIGKGTK